MAPLAALTGGTGFVGRHIARALVAQGWRLRLLARRDPVDPLWSRLQPEVVLGDLSAAEPLRRLCRGADAVVHAAGLVKAADAAAFDVVNAAGALSMARTADEVAPEAAFVLVSSLAARAPHLSAYAASKRGGEIAVGEVLDGRAWIVRLPALYGPEDRQTLPLFRAAAASPWLPVLGAGVRLPFLHVEDAAAALAALAAIRSRGGERELSDERPNGYSLAEVMTAAGRASGRRPSLVRIPPVAMRALGLAGDLGWRLGAAPIMTSGKVRELLDGAWAMASTARGDELPSPRFGLVDGFQDTADWYRAAGWLDRPVRIAV